MMLQKKKKNSEEVDATCIVKKEKNPKCVPLSLPSPPPPRCTLPVSKPAMKFDIYSLV